ncbi:AzlD domain-containing protein [Thermomicrobiaceae bacterium CFH 74404]|uniref:AzlD domain-containing protein n=1 Tax=Thermalbibacter longus TaxID=2951981 RepID=A0AA41WI49_9BACT|nr:AzlD domain-containing protein [Thermalbibacter longus]MCM8749796.1 AzlD domain-containing protein [Thermalbibacter longus]
MERPVILTIVAMGLALYWVRLSGLLLSRISMPRNLENAFKGLAPATLAALVVASLLAHPQELGWRAPAAVAALAVAIRWPRMEVCLATGMFVYLVLRWTDVGM